MGSPRTVEWRIVRTVEHLDSDRLAVCVGDGGQQFLVRFVASGSPAHEALRDDIAAWNRTQPDGVSLLPVLEGGDGDVAWFASSVPSVPFSSADADVVLSATRLAMRALGAAEGSVSGGEVLPEMVGFRSDGVLALVAPALGLGTDRSVGRFRSSLAARTCDALDTPRVSRVANKVGGEGGSAASELVRALQAAAEDGSDQAVAAAQEAIDRTLSTPAAMAVMSSGRAGDRRRKGGLAGTALAALVGVALLAAVVAIVWKVALDGGDSPQTSTLSKLETQRLEWSGCANGVECASLTVPRDWSQPDRQSDQLTLAVARRKATAGPAKGTLVVIPGGPSSSGVGLLISSEFTSGPLSGFTGDWDVVVWDHRGTGRGTHIGCGDEMVSYRSLDLAPDDAAEVAQLNAAAAKAAEECAAEDGDLLPFVDSGSSARDLDLLRSALGEERINLLSISYGTFVAQKYVATHPDRVRAAVFDSAVAPALTVPSLLEAQAASMQAFYDNEFSSCPVDPGMCEIKKLYAKVTDSLEDQPLVLAGGHSVGPTTLLFALLSAEYQTDGFEILIEALSKANRGDGTTLAAMADSYLNSSNTAQYLAVACRDLAHPEGSDEWAAMTADLTRKSPMLGALLSNEMLPCAQWPTPSLPSSPVPTKQPVPALFVTGQRDPVTPPSMARAASEQFQNATLLELDKAGHPAFTNRCAIGEMLRFLSDPASRPTAAC